MHSSVAPITRRFPVSFWISAGLFTLYSALGVIVCIEVRNDALNIIALLTVSPLMFIGMVVSVVDIVRTRKRMNSTAAYRRLQWAGLALMVGALPLWMMLAIVTITLF
jgi:hypothetical protein